MEKAQVQVIYDTKKAEKSTDELEKKTSKLGDAIDKATGGAVTGFKNFTAGLKTATGGFKGFKAAWVATGIGALVVLVTSATEWFMNFEAGVKLTRQAMAAFGAVVGKLGESLDLLIKREFAAAAESFSQIGEAAVEAAEGVERQMQAERDLFELRNRTIVQNEELRQSIEAQRKILEDTTLSSEKRLEALEKITAASKELQQNSILEAELEKARLQEEIDNVENNYERRQELQLELRQVEADLINQRGQLNIIEYEAGKIEREIRNQQREKEIADKEALNEELKSEEEAREAIRQSILATIRMMNELEEAEKERKEKAHEDAMKLADEQLEMDELFFESEEEKVAAAEAADDKILASHMKRIEQEKAFEKEKTQFTLNQTAILLGAMSQFTKEGSKLQKGLAISSVLADSAAAAIGIWKSSTSLPEPAATINRVTQTIALAAAAANSLRQIRQSDNTANAAASTVSAISGSATPSQETSAPQFNTADLIFGDNAANAVRAYVLTGDINEGQRANNKLNNLSTV